MLIIVLLTYRSIWRGERTASGQYGSTGDAAKQIELNRIISTKSMEGEGTSVHIITYITA